jgi:hypothetical protein
MPPGEIPPEHALREFVFDKTKRYDLSAANIPPEHALVDFVFDPSCKDTSSLTPVKPQISSTGGNVSYAQTCTASSIIAPCQHQENAFERLSFSKGSEEYHDMIYDSPMNSHASSAAMTVKRLKADPRNRPDIDNNAWSTECVAGKENKVIIHHRQSGRQYKVSKSQAQKAKKRLTEENISHNVCNPAACSCRRNCYKKFTISDILGWREAISVCEDEECVRKHVLGLIRPPGRLAKSTHEVHLQLGGINVCRKFFCTALMVSDKKLRGKTRDALPNANVVKFGRDKKMPLMNMDCDLLPKYTAACNFLAEFFEETCQRPSETERLFPVNQSIELIYNDYYLPWHKRHDKKYWDGPASVRTLFRAVQDELFADVKRRKNHLHVRCHTCKTLDQAHLREFREHGFVPEFWKKERAAHRAQINGWRKLETQWHRKGAHTPQEYVVLAYDDTETFGFPHFTTRTYKGLPNERCKVLPFLLWDYSRGKRTYMYSASGAYKKGANRLCTMLKGYIDAVKADTSSPARHAHTLVLIADNYSENKNNTLFAFAADLVAKNAYSEVLLIFGPVGHTHSGIDQYHNTHNNILGLQTIGDLAGLISRYPSAWTAEATRPEAAVVDVQYDWDRFYAPHINKLGGCTNTNNDAVSVHGFRFKKRNGIVEMTWKHDAAETGWRGIDGNVGSPGFIILRSQSQGAPEEISRAKTVTNATYFNKFANNKMKDAMKNEGFAKLRPALLKTMAAGIIEHGEKTITKPGTIGKMFKFGNPEVCEIEVPFLKSDTMSAKMMFNVLQNPNEDRGVGDERAMREASAAQRIPVVGYAIVPRSERPTYKHANNVKYREGTEVEGLVDSRGNNKIDAIATQIREDAGLLPRDQDNQQKKIKKKKKAESKKGKSNTCTSRKKTKTVEDSNRQGSRTEKEKESYGRDKNDDSSGTDSEKEATTYTARHHNSTHMNKSEVIYIGEHADSEVDEEEKMEKKKEEKKKVQNTSARDAESSEDEDAALEKQTRLRLQLERNKLKNKLQDDHRKKELDEDHANLPKVIKVGLRVRYHDLQGRNPSADTMCRGVIIEVDSTNRQFYIKVDGRSHLAHTRGDEDTLQVEHEHDDRVYHINARDCTYEQGVLNGGQAEIIKKYRKWLLNTQQDAENKVIQETKGTALGRNYEREVNETRRKKRKRKEHDAEAAGGSNSKSAKTTKVGKCSICSKEFNSEHGFAIHTGRTHKKDGVARLIPLNERNRNPVTTANLKRKKQKTTKKIQRKRAQRTAAWDRGESESESSMYSENESESESENSEDESAEQFVVDEILNDRRGPDNTVELLVRWSGKGKKCGETYEDTWEPAAHIEKTAGRTVREYMKRVGAC